MGMFTAELSLNSGYIRAASPNERRCIVREWLGFYNALVVGGIYEFIEPVDPKSIFTYVNALRQCVNQHPQLSTTFANSQTESPYYAFCPRIDLVQHVQFVELGEESELAAIERLLPRILDAQWSPSIPAWKIIILPLSQKKSFIAFSFSHALGDGMSGMAFHRTFLDALQDLRLEKDLIIESTQKQLSPVFDTATNLPISWNFLLSPLLGAYLPERIASFLGFRAAVSSITAGTWTGSSIFYTPDTYRTAVKILSIDAARVESALKVCRINGSKLTGLIHQLIITALSDSLPESHKYDNLVSQTAMNMRHVVGVSKDEMGNFVLGDTQSHALQLSDGIVNGEFTWALAKSTTAKLAVAATELHDQPIGLLRYLSNIRPWMASKIGGRRDCSYELSNLMSFQTSGIAKQCAVSDMVFCQPADVTGAPMSFNIVSGPNGRMNIAVSWQVGALEVGSYEDELEFIETVCQKIRHNFDIATMN